MNVRSFASRMLARVWIAVCVLALLPTHAASLPTQTPGAPDIEVSSFDGWIVTSRLVGVEVTARACDDGMVTQLSLRVQSLSSETRTGTESCLEAETTLATATPGTYRTEASAIDDDGQEAFAAGRVRLTLLPFDTATVPGFPRLEDIPEPVVGPSVRMDFLLTPEGHVRASRVVIGSETFVDDFTTMTPGPGDTTASISFNPRLSLATLEIDGQREWSGGVRQADDRWWHIVPLTDLGDAC